MAKVEVAHLRGAYSGRRVLVTGDTGFKGSWLCTALLHLGAEVSGFALPAERKEDLFEVAGLRSRMKHEDGDIRDEAALARSFSEVEPEIVFHLAAQSLVRTSYAEPRRTFQTNVLGSVNVLESVRSTPSVRSLVYVTSDKCYRNIEWVWGYRENDELGGDDPYSASKAAAELAFASYSKSFFQSRATLGAASVRAGNVIGGGDWNSNRIVPDCVRALLARQPIVLRNPSSTRPWQHVLEPVFGYLLLGARLFEEPQTYAGSWNFGPPTESVRTVRDLAEEMVQNWGSGEIRYEQKDGQPKEAGLLQLNCDKVRNLLGWQAKWSFVENVAATSRWYKGATAGESALEITEKQIRQYLGES